MRPALLAIACRYAAILTVAIAPVANANSNAYGQNTLNQVKAAFLYNFARFTEWPAEAFPSASAPMTIGVTGDEWLRAAIDDVIRGKSAGGRPLQTRQIKNAADGAAVQILYVGGASAGRAADFIKAVERLPVLTVGDVARFCDEGGMINFLIFDNKVRFEIRFDATEQSRLKVSSRVLTLAKIIHGKS